MNIGDWDKFYGVFIGGDRVFICLLYNSEIIKPKKNKQGVEME